MIWAWKNELIWMLVEGNALANTLVLSMDGCSAFRYVKERHRHLPTMSLITTRSTSCGPNSFYCFVSAPVFVTL